MLTFLFRMEFRLPSSEVRNGYLAQLIFYCYWVRQPPRVLVIWNSDDSTFSDLFVECGRHTVGKSFENLRAFGCFKTNNRCSQMKFILCLLFRDVEFHWLFFKFLFFTFFDIFSSNARNNFSSNLNDMILLSILLFPSEGKPLSKTAFRRSQILHDCDSSRTTQYSIEGLSLGNTRKTFAPYKQNVSRIESRIMVSYQNHECRSCNTFSNFPTCTYSLVLHWSLLGSPSSFLCACAQCVFCHLLLGSNFVRKYWTLFR